MREETENKEKLDQVLDYLHNSHGSFAYDYVEGVMLGLRIAMANYRLAYNIRSAYRKRTQLHGKVDPNFVAVLNDLAKIWNED